MYRVLVADPPWLFDDNLDLLTRGAGNHYACLTPKMIREFPLPPMLPDSVLFLWRVAAQQREALDVVDAWGFSPVKTELIWRKRTKHDKRWFGMGRIVRAEHEVCLIAKRGRPEVKCHDIRSIFDGVVRGHSAKPTEFYQLVEELYDGPYCELFARRQRPGWTCLGDEVEGSIVA